MRCFQKGKLVDACGDGTVLILTRDEYMNIYDEIGQLGTQIYTVGR